MRTLHSIVIMSLSLLACGTYSPGEEARAYVKKLEADGLLIQLPAEVPGVYRFKTEEAAEQFVMHVSQLGTESIGKPFTTSVEDLLPSEPTANSPASALAGPIAEWPVGPHTCRGEIEKRTLPGWGSLFNARTIHPSWLGDWEWAYARVALPDSAPMYEESSPTTPLNTQHPSTIFVAEGAGSVRSRHQCGLYRWPRRCNWFECWHVEESIWSTEVTLVVP